MDQHYYRLIENYFNKNITFDELSTLMLWVEESEINLQHFRETLQALELAESYLPKNFNPEKNWNKILKHVKAEEKVEELVGTYKTKTNWLGYAAAILLVLGSAVLFLKFGRQTEADKVVYQEIYNPKGQKRLVTMPDGSNIYLNGDTKIRYAQNFNSGKRIIYLTGEAFFDVQHRAKQPFIVYTDSISTTVLGTSFNIKSYSKARSTIITVQTGRVGVLINNGKKHSGPYFLLPNEQLTVRNNNLVEKDSVDASAVSGWREYKLAFYDTPIEDIIESISREYDIDIQFKDEKIAKTKLTVKFDKQPVQDIMSVIAKLTGKRYAIYENKIVIY
ncbi:FecR family protein [Pedobacter sp. AW1-32]|uniref:FecR family protein n=1 Tax=Pedobacter sp. AW1-32 TaxID=3383026 RepID=UPI003FEFBEF8